MMPPLITVGSRSPASSRAATIEVVVVFPWVPEIATQLFSRISSASISARRTTGIRWARAAISSGLSRLIAVDTTSTSETADIGALGGVRTLHDVTEITKHLGDAAHADAADPDKVDRSDLARQSHG